MDFLKEIFSENKLTFDEFVQAINAHNGNEANKDKQIKLENINSGNYVSKLKYEDVVQQLSGKDAEIANANSSVIIVKSVYADNAQFVTKLVNR